MLRWIVLATLVYAAPRLGAAESTAPAKGAPAPGAPSAKRSSATRAPAKRASAKAAKPARSQRGKRARRPRNARFSAPADAIATPAYRYAQLAPADCEAELARRGVAFAREPAARGVLAPVRLTGPLRGVEFRTDLSAAARATSPWEIADCRLVLALDDFAAILARHDIAQVRHYSMYRPPPKRWPDGKLGARHDGALALDAGRFIARDGRVLDVERHFHGAIGARTCGQGAAPRRATPESLALRALLCEAVDQRIFHVVLTPNYNRPHRNHFHLELTEGAKWFLVH